MSRVEALELLSKMLTFWKLGWLSISTLNVRSFAKKMVMHDASDHNGMYERTWQMDANGAFTDACWVLANVYLSNVQISLQIWKREDTCNQATLKIRTNAVDGWLVFCWWLVGFHAYFQKAPNESLILFQAHFTAGFMHDTIRHTCPWHHVLIVAFLLLLAGHQAHRPPMWELTQLTFLFLCTGRDSQYNSTNQSTFKVKRRVLGYDGHNVCNVPFDSQQSLRGSYWNPNHSTMLYEQVSKQFMRVMKFQLRFHETQQQKKQINASHKHKNQSHVLRSDIIAKRSIFFTVRHRCKCYFHNALLLTKCTHIMGNYNLFATMKNIFFTTIFFPNA